MQVSVRTWLVLILAGALACPLGAFAQATGVAEEAPLAAEESTAGQGEEQEFVEDDLAAIENGEVEEAEFDVESSADDQGLRAVTRAAIEEITITSQRRSSSLQDVPVAVTAFNSMEIEAKGFSDLRDLSNFTPNLEIKAAFAASNPTLFIRGVGLNDLNANSASAVAVYNDDVYMNSPAGQLGQMFDLEQIEVLSGPQGSLWGRNASAGAIRLISRKPSGGVGVRMTGSVGNYSMGEVEGAVEFPLIDDLLSWRGAFRYNQRDGITENRCGGFGDDPPKASEVCNGRQFNGELPLPPGLRRDVNHKKNWAGRMLLRFEPGDQDWIFNFHGGQNFGGATHFQHVGTKQRFGSSDNAGYRDNDNDPFAGDYNKTGLELLDLLGTSLKGVIPLGDYEITTVTAFERNEREVSEDSDSTPTFQVHSTWTNDAWQFSEDLTIASDYGGSVEWLAGFMFLMEDLGVQNEFDLGSPVRYEQNFTQKSRTFAFFGHGSWEFLEDFVLEGGLRYNWERKLFDMTAIRDPNGPFPPLISERTQGDWGGFSGDASITWTATEDVTVYVKYARGFKSGHFNGGALTESQASEIVEPVKPESVNNYELGLKSFWFDRRLRVNATFFFTQYQNMQVFRVKSSADDLLPLQQLINANDARNFGAEIDMLLRPVDGLEVRSNFGWLESEYLDFEDTTFVLERNPKCRTQPCTPQERFIILNLPTEYSGNRLISSPRFSWASSIQYEIPLVDIDRWGTLVPRYDVSFKDDVFFDPTEGRGIQPSKEFPKFGLGQPAFWIHNFRLSWRSPDERLEISGWVRNAFNEEYRTDAFDLSQSFAFVLHNYGDPRTYGMTFSVQW